ncbi:histidine kinase [Flavobacteriaceae bacterium R38]|nr:histidine kinase [Flavobacteriaceae bacterium R38]
MNKLFIHHPLFRIISPLCSGVLIYLLILLINNNVSQLKETFFGQELYVCIGLAYLIQEYSRLSLFFFKRINNSIPFWVKIMLQVIFSAIVCIVIVTTVMYTYYELALGFTPNFSDLTVFNSIFSVFTLIYLILYLSHHFLHKINTEKIEQELIAKEAIEQDFFQFKKGINPELLFESLESLLVLMKKDVEKAEALIDHFSSVYRYILSKKTRELVIFNEEIKILHEFLLLFEKLPYRTIQLTGNTAINTLVVPGSIIAIIEEIIRSTIASSEVTLTIMIEEEEDFFLIKYQPEEKLINTLDVLKINDIKKAYSIYTIQDVLVIQDTNYKTIKIPKLSLNESSHH